MLVNNQDLSKKILDFAMAYVEHIPNRTMTCSSPVYLKHRMIFLYREALLGQLSVYIKQTRDEFRNKTSGREEVTKQKNFPDSVNNISWVRALEIKVTVFTYRISGQGNVFGPVLRSVCPSARLSVNTLTAEPFDLRTQNLVEGCIWRISRTSLILKVKVQGHQVKKRDF